MIKNIEMVQDKLIHEYMFNDWYDRHHLGRYERGDKKAIEPLCYWVNLENAKLNIENARLNIVAKLDRALWVRLADDGTGDDTIEYPRWQG